MEETFLPSPGGLKYGLKAGSQWGGDHADIPHAGPQETKGTDAQSLKDKKGTDAKDHKTQLYFLDIYRWLPRGRKVYMIQGNILTTATTSEKVAAAKSNNC